VKINLVDSFTGGSHKYLLKLTDFRDAYMLPSFLKKVKALRKEKGSRIKKAAQCWVLLTQGSCCSIFAICLPNTSLFLFDCVEEAAGWRI
jgi:hypothetical protein